MYTVEQALEQFLKLGLVSEAKFVCFRFYNSL